MRRGKNYDLQTEKQELAYFVLNAKAKAWALRSKEEFINQLDDNIKKQKNLSYKDNPYTELYIKYLFDEKKRLGY
ncbi:MAG: hypothetical protein IPN42_02660 [Methylococcaceae bacterium]|nr:hypothetical protein [Methylococcaceae bacterium]